MWPRIAEILIAIWLAASPFVLRDESSGSWIWMNNMLCAAAVLLCAVLSFWRPLRRMHLGQIAIAFWLLGVGYLGSSEPLPMLQNNILVALVLMMFAVVPNEANQPPLSWRQMRRA